MARGRFDGLLLALHELLMHTFRFENLPSELNDFTNLSPNKNEEINVELLKLEKLCAADKSAHDTEF